MSVINLRINNPYARGTIFTFSGGEKFFRRKKIEYTQGPTDLLHLVRADDNLSNLAYKYYGDSKYWWVIADANNIHEPLDIASVYQGKNLLIPDFDKIQAFHL